MNFNTHIPAHTYIDFRWPWLPEPHVFPLHIYIQQDHQVKFISDKLPPDQIHDHNKADPIALEPVFTNRPASTTGEGSHQRYYFTYVLIVT